MDGSVTPGPMQLMKLGHVPYSIGSNSPMTRTDLGEAQKRFLAMRENLESFYNILSEGVLLSTILELTSNTSFMEQALGRTTRDAKQRNSLAEFLHGSHTSAASVVSVLPWASILIDYFTRTPIPENITAVREANDSLYELSQIVANDRQFYDSFRAGVKLPVVTASSAVGILGIDGLTFTIYGDDKPITPSIIHSEASTIRVGDKVYYNGLPADRAGFPTAMLEEGAQLALTVKNSSNRRYMVVPTINGLPFNVDSIGFLYAGFETSQFPVASLKARATYLKPEEEKTFDMFNVQRTGFVRKADDFVYDISAEFIVELSFLLGRAFDNGLTEEQKFMIAECENDLTQQIIYESRFHAVKALEHSLRQPRQSSIYVSRPTIADGKASSELDNPFLGSLGLLVVEVSRPPVKDTHSYSYLEMGGVTNRMLSLGATRGVGGAGLANIIGGADVAAEREYGDFQYSDAIHSFAGFVPINLMSLQN